MRFRFRVRLLPYAWCLPALLSLAAPGLALAQVADLVAVRDNTLFQSATGDLSNGAGPVFFAGDAGLVPRRGLVRFDVAGPVPASAIVTGVVLTLNLSMAPNTNAVPIELRRAAVDWGEGTSSTSSGAGAPATAGDATWLHTFSPGSFWTSAGGDFAETASASRTVTGVGSYTWSSPGMIADVQAWLDDPAHDFGWLLLGDETGSNTARRFDARENATVANRPKLTVTYVVGDPARSVSWSRLKTLYR